MISGLFDLIFDNIGIVLTILIVYFAYRSKKKKKAAHREEELFPADNIPEQRSDSEGLDERTLEEIFFPKEVFPSEKSKPWAASAEDAAARAEKARQEREAEKARRRAELEERKRRRHEAMESRSFRPWEPEKKPFSPPKAAAEKVAAVAEPLAKEPVSPSKPAEPAVAPWSGNDLVNAVIMAEVLGTPKALRDEHNV